MSPLYSSLRYHFTNEYINPTAQINKKVYARLDMIGKGGSSRVYRVMNIAHEIYAIKRVSLDKTDADTMSGYMNEIALLKRLEGNNRIIRLVDSELKAGPGGSKGHLLLLLECGEIGGFFSQCLRSDLSQFIGGGDRSVETSAGTAEGAYEYGLDIILLAASECPMPSWILVWGYN